jgi:hypothetical protein
VRDSLLSEPGAGDYKIVADTIEDDPHEYEVGEIVTLTGKKFTDTLVPEIGTRYQTTDHLWVAAADIVPHE